MADLRLIRAECMPPSDGRESSITDLGARSKWPGLTAARPDESQP